MYIRVKNFNDSGYDVELNLSSKIICLCGHSGSGKSSLLNMIHGIREYDGECDISHSVYMTQTFKLINDLSVEDNIFLDIRERNIQLMHYYLNEFGLLNKLNSSVASMSGGERQRICIVRSLMRTTDVLLLDEPTSALDAKNKEITAKLLLALNCKHIIIASHDKDFFDLLNGTFVYFNNSKISLIK